MGRYILDIESNGLLHVATHAWIIGVLDIDTGEIRWWPDGDLGWQSVLNDAKLIVGHNVLGFDLPLLKKLFK